MINQEESIEKKAIRIVMEYEKKQGRNPIDVSKDRKEVGYDILSEDRKIEVKGISCKRNNFVSFNNYNFQCFKKEHNFYLYIVFDADTNPKLIIWDRIESAERIRQAKIYFNFEIPLRKKDWEEGISV